MNMIMIMIIIKHTNNTHKYTHTHTHKKRRTNTTRTAVPGAGALRLVLGALQSPRQRVLWRGAAEPGGHGALRGGEQGVGGTNHIEHGTDMAVAQKAVAKVNPSGIMDHNLFDFEPHLYIYIYMYTHVTMYIYSVIYFIYICYIYHAHTHTTTYVYIYTHIPFFSICINTNVSDTLCTCDTICTRCSLFWAGRTSTTDSRGCSGSPSFLSLPHPR